MNGNKPNKLDIHNYDDIINMPRPDLKNHARMSVSDRAAQFKPFAALTGYEDVICEVSRDTEARIILDDQEKAVLNRKLVTIRENIDAQPAVSVTYYLPDTKKTGGSYRSVTGKASQIDPYEDLLILSNGKKIKFGSIIKLEIISGYTGQ